MTRTESSECKGSQLLDTIVDRIASCVEMLRVRHLRHLVDGQFRPIPLAPIHARPGDQAETIFRNSTAKTAILDITAHVAESVVHVSVSPIAWSLSMTGRHGRIHFSLRNHRRATQILAVERFSWRPTDGAEKGRELSRQEWPLQLPRPRFQADSWDLQSIALCMVGQIPVLDSLRRR